MSRRTDAVIAALSVTPNKRCGEKLRHAHEFDAKQHVRRLKAKGKAGARTYRCPDCGYWHVGAMAVPRAAQAPIALVIDDYRAATRRRAAR